MVIRHLQRVNLDFLEKISNWRKLVLSFSLLVIISLSFWQVLISVLVVSHLDSYYKSPDSKDGDSIPGSKAYTILALQAVFRCILSIYSIVITCILYSRVVSRFLFILDLPQLLQERIQRAFQFENMEGDAELKGIAELVL